jgi:hypothetical protein
MRVVAWVSLVAVGVACGSSTSGGGTNGTPGAPICAKSSVELSGMLEGASANGSYSGPSSYAFINALGGQPGTIDVSFGSGGTLHLQWANLLADDQSGPATGTLTMPSEGPHAGQIYCVTAATVVPRSMTEGGGTSFTLSSLAKGACPGAGVSGTLDGCAAPN